jgi:hypothetical protein
VLAERETRSASTTRAAKTTTPPSPACRRSSTPTRSTPRATRLCSASATPTPARRTTLRSPGLPAPSRAAGAPSIWTAPPQAYAKVITRYPMAPHVEDARDRLVAMNRPVPEPTEEAVAESDAEERSRSRCASPTRPGHHQARPTVVEAVHVGEPRSTIPSAPWRRRSPRTSAPRSSARPTRRTPQPAQPQRKIPPR